MSSLTFPFLHLYVVEHLTKMVHDCSSESRQTIKLQCKRSINVPQILQNFSVFHTFSQMHVVHMYIAEEIGGWPFWIQTEKD
jgi:hypothetical protein